MRLEFYDYRGADMALSVENGTFMYLPWVGGRQDLRQADPDAAILGEPFDPGTAMRPGARYGGMR